MTDHPIIVFDSGRGGRSIFDPLQKALPQATLLYMDDHEHFPYGNKSPAWLTKRFHELALRFSSLDPLLLVLACNTATVNGVLELRKLLTCPIIGVEPVIKPLSHFPRALVLMTHASAKAKRTLDLIQQYGPHVEVYTPKGLAEAIEYNKIDQIDQSIHEIKTIALNKQIQAIGLSCTHYPLVLDKFQLAMPQIKFFDPSQAVVDQVNRVLKSN
jgi:glutamate racemase